jgi:hypothetical protein
MTLNIPWNECQPHGAAPIEKTWKAMEVIPLQCNIHPWVHGWFVVVKGHTQPPTQKAVTQSIRCRIQSLRGRKTMAPKRNK